MKDSDRFKIDSEDIELDIFEEEQEPETQIEFKEKKDLIREAVPNNYPPGKQKEKLKESYKGGFWRYKNEVLNTTYHTMTLIFHVFLGYMISSIRYEGFEAWKTRQSVYFYGIFAIGYAILTVFELSRYKEDEHGQE